MAVHQMRTDMAHPEAAGKRAAGDVSHRVHVKPEKVIHRIDRKMKIIFAAQIRVREEIGAERVCRAVRGVLDEIDGIADVEAELVLHRPHNEAHARFERVRGERPEQQAVGHEGKFTRLRRCAHGGKEKDYRCKISHDPDRCLLKSVTC